MRLPGCSGESDPTFGCIGCKLPTDMLGHVWDEDLDCSRSGCGLAYEEFRAEQTPCTSTAEKTVHTGRKALHTLIDRNEVMDLRERGWSFERIGDHYKVSRYVIQRLVRGGSR